MGTFIVVVLVILGIIAFIAVLGGTIMGVIWAHDSLDRPWLPSIGISLAGVILAALLITWGVTSLPEGDGSEHCGAGTRYVSESHYNPATKTTVTDWMCVA